MTASAAVPAVPEGEFASHFLELPAGRLRYVDEGRGETLLFSHGTPTFSHEWRHLIRALSPRYRCVAPDHLGFGFSDRPRDFSYAPEAHAENFLGFARALDLRDVTLVVHDFGGPIALPLCLEEPGRVKRLAVINTWMWSFAGDADMEKKARMAGGALGRFLYRRANFALRVLMPYAYGDRRKLTPEIHRVYRERFPDADSRERVLWTLARSLLGSSDFYRGLWEKRAALREKPALLIWGLKDRAFPARMLERWREALPEAEVATLPDSGHWPHEEEPETVIAALRRFIGS